MLWDVLCSKNFLSLESGTVVSILQVSKQPERDWMTGSQMQLVHGQISFGAHGVPESQVLCPKARQVEDTGELPTWTHPVPRLHGWPQVSSHILNKFQFCSKVCNSIRSYCWRIGRLPQGLELVLCRLKAPGLIAITTCSPKNCQVWPPSLNWQ